MVLDGPYTPFPLLGNFAHHIFGELVAYEEQFRLFALSQVLLLAMADK
jgi:hypothetical protein